MTDAEDRLRRAAAAHAAAVPEPADRWDEVEQRAAGERRKNRLQTLGVTSLGLAAAVIAAVLILPKVFHEPPDTITAGPGVTSTTATPSTTTPEPAPPFAYQPLWPFRTADEAGQWQASYRNGGHEPWHLDPGQTALNFTQHFLGYADVDTVTSKKIDSNGAHIGVGFTTEGTLKGTAAIVHLAKIGGGTDAPWEVVGTDDNDLTLTTPSYGASVASPITVGGVITGVDESLKVQVRQVTFPGLIGEKCCLPGGGEKAPWSTTVSFTGATDNVLTISVSTGGHLKDVERFAVTGVHVGP